MTYRLMRSAVPILLQTRKFPQLSRELFVIVPARPLVSRLPVAPYAGTPSFMLLLLGQASVPHAPSRLIPPLNFALRKLRCQRLVIFPTQHRSLVASARLVRGPLVQAHRIPLTRQARILTLERLERLQLRSAPLLELLVPFLYAWLNHLELLEVGIHSRRRRSQRPPVLGLVLLGMVEQVLEHEIGVAVEQEVGLRVVAFCFVDLGLGPC